VGCAEDPACINRLHPDIPMVANADPGERIVFVGRDAFDLTLDPDKFSSADTMPREGLGIVHALTGPVFINGAKAGSVPADLAYLDSPKIAGLSNLSADINLAARNALAAMIDYIMSEYGYDRTQAYMIASIAVDMRIGQLVDVPNVGVTAILPLDIFVGHD